MGQSAYASVGFGALLEEGDSLPWESDEFEGDEAEWWRRQCGWRDEFIYSPIQAENAAYFERQRAFDDANPLPVVVTWRGWGDYRETVLCVPGSVQSVEYDGDFDVSRVIDFDEDATAFLAFCERYGIKLRHRPRWLLFAKVW